MVHLWFYVVLLLFFSLLNEMLTTKMLLRYNKKRKTKWKSVYMKFASCLVTFVTMRLMMLTTGCGKSFIFTGNQMHTKEWVYVTCPRWKWNFTLKELIYCIFDPLDLIKKKYSRKKCSTSYNELFRWIFCAIHILNRLLFSSGPRQIKKSPLSN